MLQRSSKHGGLEFKSGAIQFRKDNFFRSNVLKTEHRRDGKRKSRISRAQRRYILQILYLCTCTGCRQSVKKQTYPRLSMWTCTGHCAGVQKCIFYQYKHHEKQSSASLYKNSAFLAFTCTVIAPSWPVLGARASLAPLLEWNQMDWQVSARLIFRGQARPSLYAAVSSPL